MQNLLLTTPLGVTHDPSELEDQREEPGRSPHQYPRAAQNFVTAYANTNYLNPLKGEDLSRFYVSRGLASELKLILGELRVGAQASPPTNTKFLFVGHTGCGKSTELARLVSMIKNDPGYTDVSDKFLPIQYSISELVGLYNLEFVDIALSIILGIYREIERLGYLIDDSPARRVYDWVYPDAGAAAPLPANSAMNLGLGSLIRLIDVRLKNDGEIRETIRVRVRKYIPEMIALINQVIFEVYLATGKNILLIVDDLDKIQPLEAALSIFKEHVRSLTSFDCFAIYTAPVSLLYDPAFKYLSQFFEVHYMPMFRTRVRDGQPEPAASEDIQTLREIITRRISPALFEDGVMEAAIYLTGGVLRELIRVLRSCCVYCEEYGLARISYTVLNFQKNKLKAEYYRILEEEDYHWLQRVRESKDRTDVNMRHLESLCVLYYPGAKGWFDLHPVVVELVEEWQNSHPERSRPANFRLPSLSPAFHS